MKAAVAELTSAVPTLTQASAAAALEVAVPIPVRGAARFLEELAAHLADHPDALFSGGSHCPPALIRLTHVLHDGGHPVTRIVCAHCGKPTTELRQMRPEGRICGTCDGRSRRSTCARCGQDGVRIAARRPEGKICYRCYSHDPEPFEECSHCGRVDKPVSRLDDGSMLCKRCWQRPEHRCIHCGQTKPAALIDNQGASCHLCYNRFRRPRRICGQCGRERTIARNADGDRPDLCHSCYRGPKVICSNCGKLRPCHGIGTGHPICQSCYRRPTHTCCRCGRQRRINAHWPMGPVCDLCYTAVLRDPGECASCRTTRALIGRDTDGNSICGPCAGYDADYTCRRCGRAGNPYGREGCAHCVLADRVHELLASPDGQVSSELWPLVDALTRTQSPFKQIHWIKNSPNAHLLAQLVTDGRPLSHDLLDEFPPSRNVHYIRQMLTQTGILPERHEDLDRLPAWLDHHLIGKPADHANLIRPFAHWHLLRRARSRARVRRFPASAGRDLRRRILVALDLLVWLDEQSLTLASLRQAELDRWLDEPGTQRRNLVRYFLNWTSKRRITEALVVPSIPRQQPAELLDDEQRWRLLRQCLNDDELPVDVRAAGALTLLFGLSTERLRHLTADQLTHKDGQDFLTAGHRPILLPPKLAKLLWMLGRDPQRRLAIPEGKQRPHKLFPGLVPGQPIANHALTTRLARYGIRVRTARNGALAALAADLPAAVLADLLGMHINTAIRWVDYAGGDWTDYLAARAAERARGSAGGRE
ncbi:XRE family transcriptional regulator [Nocardia arizonensis]|uniref:XRE family transcriptional regulator n=1 Tax=Nocardia arizonensis TaxID=1141647 RepID=UPI000B0AEDDE|nr:XRE family transcriptional regulator [Nocardia arizonensis]